MSQESVMPRGVTKKVSYTIDRGYRTFDNVLTGVDVGVSGFVNVLRIAEKKSETALIEAGMEQDLDIMECKMEIQKREVDLTIQGLQLQKDLIDKCKEIQALKDELGIKDEEEEE